MQHALLISVFLLVQGVPLNGPSCWRIGNSDRHKPCMQGTRRLTGFILGVLPTTQERLGSLALLGSRAKADRSSTIIQLANSARSPVFFFQVEGSFP